MEKESDVYKIISDRSEGLFKDKGSKFYAFAIPVTTEEEAKEQIAVMRKRFYDATHVCTAYTVGLDREIYRLNDDGEPSGTAAAPIYGQIISHDLVNVLIVVVRYFGGIKLGVRGLINAYKLSAEQSLLNADIKQLLKRDVYELHYQYPQMNRVMYLIKEENLEQISTNFEIDCRLRFAVRKTKSKQIYEKFKDLYPLTIAFIETI